MQPALLIWITDAANLQDGVQIMQINVNQMNIETFTKLTTILTIHLIEPIQINRQDLRFHEALLEVQSLFPFDEMVALHHAHRGGNYESAYRIISSMQQPQLTMSRYVNQMWTEIHAHEDGWLQRIDELFP